jgi:hypothetical protein
MKPYKYAYIGVNDSGRNTILDKYHYKHSEYEIHGFIDKAKLYSGRDLLKANMIRVISGNSSRKLVSFYDIIQSSDRLFLMGGLGARTGNKYFPILSRMLSENNANYKCIVNTPFYFEGKTRQKSAEKVLKNLKRYCVVHVISLQYILRKYGKMKLKKAFNRLMLMCFEWVDS